MIQVNNRPFVILSRGVKEDHHPPSFTLLTVDLSAFQIEECILDNLAWKADSPVWEAIKANEKIPSCEEVRMHDFAEHDGHCQSTMAIILVSRASGCYLDTQTLKNHLSVDPPNIMRSFVKCQFQAYLISFHL